jgi:hypothetical protein
VTKGQVLAKYKHMSPEERRSFDRWLQANVVIGSMFGIALVAMALTGSRTPTPAIASAPPKAWTTSFQEQLPVNQIKDRTVVFTVTDPEAESVIADKQ